MPLPPAGCAEYHSAKQPTNQASEQAGRRPEATCTPPAGAEGPVLSGITQKGISQSFHRCIGKRSSRASSLSSWRATTAGLSTLCPGQPPPNTKKRFQAAESPRLRVDPKVSYQECDKVNLSTPGSDPFAAHSMEYLLILACWPCLGVGRAGPEGPTNGIIHPTPKHSQPCPAASGTPRAPKGG